MIRVEASVTAVSLKETQQASQWRIIMVVVKVASRSSSCSTVTSILTLVTMLLLRSANTTNTNLERSKIGFDSWPLHFNSRITSDSVKKSLEISPFVNFVTAGKATRPAQRNGSDITGAKVTFEGRFQGEHQIQL